ncbi:hypothetical protein F4808DRAFT_418831 [Astrocystis sublimbata]|nr:hypothetical protein F4808DRAFT_418831 [Astrocystis sublimbata]
MSRVQLLLQVAFRCSKNRTYSILHGSELAIAILLVGRLAGWSYASRSLYMDTRLINTHERTRGTIMYIIILSSIVSGISPMLCTGMQ